MSEQLLKSYIQLRVQQINEAPVKSGDLNLLSNQNLGYAAEWAVYESIDGEYSLLQSKGAGPVDGRLVRPWAAASPNGKEIFKKIYRMMVVSASTALQQSPTFQTEKPSAVGEEPPGVGTRPVDVVSDIADIHVKYNDAARLAGFQRARREKEETVDPVTKKKLVAMREIPSTRTAMVFDAGMSQFIDEIIEEAGVDLEGYVTGGLLRKPTTLSSRDKSRESLANWKKFERAKVAYQDAVQRTGRERLLQILDELGIEKAILTDINAQLFGGTRKKGEAQKKTVFAKFFASKFESEDDVANFDAEAYRQSLRCHFIDYKLSMGLSNPMKQLFVYTVPSSGFKREKSEIAAAAMKKAARGAISPAAQRSFSVAGLSTVFYLVTGTGDKSENIYFKIEFRLDGEGHPPQLKVGPDLDQL